MGNPAAAAGPEGLPPGHEPFRGGAWPGGSSGALFLTGQIYFSPGEDDGFVMHGSPAYPPVTIQLPEEPRQG